MMRWEWLWVCDRQMCLALGICTKLLETLAAEDLQGCESYVLPRSAMSKPNAE